MGKRSSNAPKISKMCFGKNFQSALRTVFRNWFLQYTFLYSIRFWFFFCFFFLLLLDDIWWCGCDDDELQRLPMHIEVSHPTHIQCPNRFFTTTHTQEKKSCTACTSSIISVNVSPCLVVLLFLWFECCSSDEQRSSKSKYEYRFNFSEYLIVHT